MISNQSIEYSKSGNVIYKIDYDTKLITAEIRCSKFEPQYLFDSQLFKCISGSGLGPIEETYPIRNLEIKPSYIGKAKCHPDDEFDVDFGKKLALLRAKEKYQRALARKIFKIYCWFDDLMLRVDNLYIKHFDSYYDTVAKLEDIGKRMGL